MEHILDNPAWNALISGNKHLSNGSEGVKYFDKEISPFVAFKENTPESFQLLYELIPHNNPVIFISPHKMDIPGRWKVLLCVEVIQMVCDDVIKKTYRGPELISLTVEHVPQMMALTKLTNPGPFAEKTIDFGHYRGIFDGDKLVAMAGQRLHIFNYAEVSAVCTHPDYSGRGYARQLLLYQMNRIIAASDIPFLHVRNDNERAIKVYSALGFVTRREIFFYVMQKAFA
jgi:ribosomal protein S18 acetylase RimI-like enzyme